MNAMHKAFLSGARVVALYSQPYLDSMPPKFAGTRLNWLRSHPTLS
jgi:hypothetical protein